MIFDSKKLLYALVQCSKAIGKNPLIDSVSHLLLTVNKGTVSVTGSNLATTLTISYDTDIDGELKELIDPGVINLITGSSVLEIIPKDDTISFTIDGNIEIQYEKIDSGHYPIFNNHRYNNSTIAMVDGSYFIQELLDAALHTTSDEMRLAMTGIYCETVIPPGIKMVASDGHTLKVNTINADWLCPVEKTFIIPRKISKIASLFKSTTKKKNKIEDFCIKESDNNIAFYFIINGYHVSIETRTHSSMYPDFNAIIHQHEKNKSFTINRAHFLAELNRALRYTDFPSNIKLNLKEKTISIENNYTLGIQKYSVRLNLDSDWDTIFTFNCRYLIKVLESAKGMEEVTFKFHDERRPVVLETESGLLLIMPVIIY